MLPHEDEHLLGDVLGQRIVAENPSGQCVDQPRIAVIDLGQSPRLSGHEARHQLEVLGAAPRSTHAPPGSCWHPQMLPKPVSSVEGLGAPNPSVLLLV